MGLLADSYTRVVAPIVQGCITGEIPIDRNNLTATTLQAVSARAAMKLSLQDLKAAVDATSADLATRIALIP